jgi:hypothetical protein
VNQKIYPLALWCDLCTQSKRFRKVTGSVLCRPTWTGKAGSAGAPGAPEPPRFGKQTATTAPKNGSNGTVRNISGHRKLNILTAASNKSSAAPPSAAEVIARFRERQAAEAEAAVSASTGADTASGAMTRPRQGPQRAAKRSVAPAPAQDVSSAQVPLQSLSLLLVAS